MTTRPRESVFKKGPPPSETESSCARPPTLRRVAVATGTVGLLIVLAALVPEGNDVINGPEGSGDAEVSDMANDSDIPLSAGHGEHDCDEVSCELIIPGSTY